MEYYGPKPKKFTKEWWPYFWDYYKWHTIAVAAAVIAIVSTVVQVANQDRYDGSFVCAGDVAFPMEYADKFESYIEEAVDDIDSNGEKAVLFEQLTFSENDVDAQYSAAMRMKFDLKLQTNESFAFIMDKNLAEKTLASPDTEGCFATTDEWLTEKVSEENIYYSDGKPYAIKLTNSAILKNMGFKGDDFYAVLRYNYDKSDEELNKQFENAKKMLNAVVREN